tara:strand:- start:945 stop:1724 length:780 start_codon:yes stop_codon:yes gene_type:complete
MTIKLICGIIATRKSNTNGKSCEDFKKEWLKLIEKNKILNTIEFFFLYSSQDVSGITIEGMDFIVPGVERKNTILHKTIAFFKYILKEKKECTHILRTNLSSFYNFPLLLDKLNTLKRTDLVLGSKEKNNKISAFPSGCGTIFSIDVIHRICEHFSEDKKDVLKGKQIIYHDDVAIGEILRKMGVKITHLEYVNLQRMSKEMQEIKDFIDGVKIKESSTRTISFKPWFIEKLKNENLIHYRCSNPEFKFIFQKLIEKYY